MARFRDRLAHAFNTFFTDENRARGPQDVYSFDAGPMSSYRPDRPRLRVGHERTLVASIYTRMAVDCSEPNIEHVRKDEDGQYVATIDSGLNNCLNVEANLDQAPRHFKMDLVTTMFQEGCIAILPVDTTLNPDITGSWDILTMRVGIVIAWYPEHVRVRAYNQKTGQAEEITVSKRTAAIVENPFYAVMNEPNSTLQRLIHKLALMDSVDEITSSGKLDIIIQLPFTVKGETRKTQAEKRVREIQEQLQGSSYGIAYADATEKITQLNRSVTNNLLDQVKYLKEQVYDELGLTASIMNGTASADERQSYINRVVEPVLDAIVEAMRRTFLTKTARSQHQDIMYFQSPFKLLPIDKLADIVDALSRNQIVTPNEIRPAIGLKPSKQPQADSLVNSNMPLKDQVTGDVPSPASQEPAAPVDPADIEEANLDSSMAELGV